MEIKIHNVRGHDGLPDQFIVQSRYGWLGKDGYVHNLEKATIFRTIADAQAELERLFSSDSTGTKTA